MLSRVRTHYFTETTVFDSYYYIAFTKMLIRGYKPVENPVYNRVYNFQ
jgi:hypothetical protein